MATEPEHEERTGATSLAERPRGVALAWPARSAPGPGAARSRLRQVREDARERDPVSSAPLGVPAARRRRFGGHRAAAAGAVAVAALVAATTPNDSRVASVARLPPASVPAVATAGSPPLAAYFPATPAAATPPSAADLETTRAPGAVTEIAIRFALAQIGLPYVWGGDGPAAGEVGFDCSGLTTAAYAAAGIALPRTAHTQYHRGPRVAPGTPLLAGDLIFYGVPARVHHVGLYLGDGLMVNAPRRGKPIQIAPIRWAGDSYLGATRPAGGYPGGHVPDLDDLLLAPPAVAYTPPPVVKGLLPPATSGPDAPPLRPADPPDPAPPLPATAGVAAAEPSATDGGTGGAPLPDAERGPDPGTPSPAPGAPAGAPPTGAPPTGAPASESPSTGTHAPGAPAPGQEPPAQEEPATDPGPANEPPSEGAPTGEAPPAEEPTATDPPPAAEPPPATHPPAAAEPPAAADPPATDPPATDPPAEPPPTTDPPAAAEPPAATDPPPATGESTDAAPSVQPPVEGAPDQP